MVSNVGTWFALMVKPPSAPLLSSRSKHPVCRACACRVRVRA
jgi:hypothetical protein